MEFQEYSMDKIPSVRPGGRDAFLKVSGHLLDSASWFDTGQVPDTQESYLLTPFLLSAGHRRGKEKKKKKGLRSWVNDWEKTL